MPEIIGTAGFPTDDTGAVIMPADTPALQTTTLSSTWDYEQSNAAPAAGFAYQSTNNKTLAINTKDHGTVDRSSFFAQLTASSTIVCNGVTWDILSISIAGSVATINVAPAITAPPFGVTTLAFTAVPAGTGVFFPAFDVIVPPPTIGNPFGVPAFPPPTPPPIGTVPAGPLVGPAVAAAAVPPSVAGVVQPQYKTGSATSPTAASFFPSFTTTPAYAGFPNQPPAGVPIVFANVWATPTLSGGVWTAHPPASTATVGQIILNGWGLPGPSGLGPGPPSNPNPPGAGLPHVFESVPGGYSEPAQRSGGPVFQFADAGQLHQSVPPTHSRRKRMPARSAAGGNDLP